MEYLLKSSAILALFYIFYQVLLKQETFFQSIRVYFLTGIISSIALPLIVIQKYVELAAFNFSSHIITEEANILTAQNIDWTVILPAIYFMGVAFFSLRFLAQLISLFWLLFSQPKERNNGYNFINSTKNIAPFSFFHYIVYNKAKFNNKELQQIFTHEKVHVDQHHSVDILASQLLVIVQWFNPIAWLFHKEIQNNLEFIADANTLKVSKEKKQYQYLLLKTMSPNYSLTFTTNFYNSLIKKRIQMLEKKPSKRSMQLKFLFIIPILIAFIATFNTKVIAQQKKTKLIEIQTEIYAELISKDFQKADFENLKERLAKKDVSFTYSKLKYNSKNEITGISINLKNKSGNQSNLSQDSSTPISPIQIKLNISDNSISVGNVSEDIHWISKDFEMNEDADHQVYVVTTNGKKIRTKKGENVVFLSDENEDNSNVWVSKNGDSTVVKKVEIIKMNGGDAKVKKFIIRKDDDQGEEKEEIIIKTIDKNKENKAAFLSSSNDKPLIIIDGIVSDNQKIEDIDPDSIESMNVLKGEKATEKYGDKAKDGVIEITTKKN